jgi:thiol-disulfide isomerase/thioredoxin
MFQFQPKLIAVLTTIGLVIVAAVYLMLEPERNGLSQNADVAALQSYATGHMSNFRASSTPETLVALPDIDFLDEAGKTVHLSDFQGRVLLLNLWATWCVPCREEMPALDRLQGEIGSDKFQVLALSVDKNGLKEAGAFLKEVKADHLALYNDPTSSANFKLKGYGLPTTLLVSPDGVELGRVVGPAEWDQDEAKALIAAAVKLYGR